MRSLDGRTAKRLKTVLRYGFVISASCFLWIVAIVITRRADAIADYLQPPGETAVADLATLLFAAASFALFLFSTLMGVLAVFGWQTLEATIRGRVEAGIKKELDAVTTEMQGRLLSGLGYMIGEMNSSRTSLEPLDRERLYHAVELCREGYKLLQGSEDAAKYMALNNLVYYSAIYGDPIERRSLFKNAELLREEAENHGSPVDLMLTYCRVMLQPGADSENVEKGISNAEMVLLRRDASDLQLNEAKFYLTSLSKILDKMNRSKSPA